MTLVRWSWRPYRHVQRATGIGEEAGALQTRTAYDRDRSRTGGSWCRPSVWGGVALPLEDGQRGGGVLQFRRSVYGALVRGAGRRTSNGSWDAMTTAVDFTSTRNDLLKELRILVRNKVAESSGLVVQIEVRFIRLSSLCHPQSTWEVLSKRLGARRSIWRIK